MSSGVRLARAPRRLRAARPRDIRRRLSALCTAPAATRRAHLDRALPCAVVHHTDCGMEYFKSEELAKLLETSLATANIVPLESAPKGVTFENASAEGGSHDGHAVHWLHIDDQEASVREDVAKIVGHSLTAPGIPVHGYIYHVATGAIQHVVTQVTA